MKYMDIPFLLIILLLSASPAHAISLYDPQNLNRYAYVRDNPLKYTDPTGNYFLTTGIDIASLAISIHDIRQDPANKWNWVALTADVATLALPVVAGGGMAVRAVKGMGKAGDMAKNIPLNPYKATHPGRNMEKHISKQQAVGDAEWNRLMKEGKDPDNIEIKYGKPAYDLETEKLVKGTKADVQAFDKTTGKPLSKPYEIEPNTPRGQKNYQMKDEKYGSTKYEKVEYEK